MKSYISRHLNVVHTSVASILRTPGASLMTMSVIGITLALPMILYLLVENVQVASHDWQGRAQLTLYLKHGLSAQAQRKLVAELETREEFARVEFISAETALAEIKRDPGFRIALEALPENPLPPAVVLYLQIGNDNAGTAQRVQQEYAKRPEVEEVRADMAWLQRLHTILDLIKSGVWVMAALLAFAVVAIISNTIRLHVLNRRDEIEIIKLVGGSNAFIRRPFLYYGFLQGLGGAALAWAFVSFCLYVIRGPAGELSSLYGAQFQLQGLRWTIVAALLTTGGVLGWLASRLAVQRHLAQIEPK